MPDWTYQTLFKPVFRRMSFEAAQTLAFGTMGRLGRTAAGRQLIRWMGHAAPDDRISFEKAGLRYSSHVGISSGIDQQSQATSALSLFGVSIIEVGPVCLTRTRDKSVWDTQKQGIRIPASAGISVEEIRLRLQENAYRNQVQIVVRLPPVSDIPSDEFCRTIETLKPVTDRFSVPVSSAADLQDLATLAADNGVDILPICDVASISEWGPELDQTNFTAVVLEAGHDENQTRGLIDAKSKQQAVTGTRRLKDISPDRLIVVSGGVEEPKDALRLLDSGADVVLLDSGFVESGPGLPKRINQAVLSRQLEQDKTPPDSVPDTQRSWFWALLLGMALTGGGLLAFFLGWTRVLLPYDEEFLEMMRDEICGISDRLLPFMSHDRVTLAGTMLSLGPLYMCLAYWGDRRGQHWARVTFLTSSLVGFFSFFLFLGFGYFDPFHAFVAAICFQLTTLCLRSSQTKSSLAEFDLENSIAWKRALWGQLLMVIHGIAVFVAGIVICGYGVSTVFVPEDLEFMQISQQALVAANPRLIPLVAHDRASFGGMLLSTGVTIFLTALWGWQRGRRWLWWTLLGSGTIAYLTTIVIHWAVGYTSLKHLLPAYGGLAILWVAMSLTKPWMFEDATVDCSKS